MVRLILAFIALLISAVSYAAPTAIIDESRTSCTAPCAVFFDGAGTTSTTATFPYHKLLYVWTFSDPTSGSWDNHSRNEAYGPQAAHVFRTAGSYLVTLTVTDIDDSVDDATTTITVADPNTATFSGTATRCFSNDTDFTGCPSGAQQVTTSNHRTAINSHIGNNRRLLFKRADVFTSTQQTNIGDTNNATTLQSVQIGAFGTGVAPILQATQSGLDTNNFRLMNAVDLVISDLEIKGTGATVPSGQKDGHDCIHAYRRTQHVLIYNNTFTPGTCHKAINFSGTFLDVAGQDNHFGLFVVSNTIDNPGNGQSGIQNGGYAAFVSARKMAFLGNFIDNIKDGAEHGIRVQHFQNAVISHNHVARQDRGRSLISLRGRDNSISCSSGCGEPARRAVISENKIYCASDQCVTFIAKNAANKPTIGQDVIVERNFCSRDPDPTGISETCFQAQDTTTGVTIRNNIILANGEWRRHEYIENSASNVFINNNTAYTDESYTGQVIFLKLDAGTNLNANNNILSAPNAGSRAVVSSAVTVTAQNSNVATATVPFVSATPLTPSDFEPADGGILHNAGANGLSIAHLDYFRNTRPSGPNWDVGAIERQDPAAGPDLTLTIGSSSGAQFGNGWGAVTCCPEQVRLDFTSPATDDLTLSVVGYNVINSTRVEVRLNGNSLTYLTPGPTNDVNGGDLINIPVADQINGNNTVLFVLGFAGASWGVTNLSLNEATANSGQISGVVYDDTDGSGTFDTGETGVNGATVTLSGAANDSAIVGANGVYTFAELPAGSYTLSASISGLAPYATYRATNDPDGGLDSSAAIDLAAAENLGGQHFGFAPPGSSLSGIVYRDENSNGDFDVGEPLIAGAIVTLSGAADDSITTGIDGAYAFTALSAGIYTVTVDISSVPALSSYVVSEDPDGGADGVYAYALGDDEPVVDLDIGYKPPPPPGGGSVSGIVYIDADGDGVKDVGEVGIAGAGVAVNGVASYGGTTSGSGAYTISGIVPGAYLLTIDVGGTAAEDFRNVEDPDGGRDSTYQFVIDGEAFAGLDFGFYDEPTPTIEQPEYEEDPRVVLAGGPPIAGATDLVRYQFEGSGGTVTDSGAALCDATLNGAVRDAGGKIGNGVLLDGVDDSIDLCSAFDTSGLGVTVMLWAYFDTSHPTNPQTLFAQVDGDALANQHLALAVLPDAALRARVSLAGTVYELVGPRALVNTGRWHHIAVAADGVRLVLYLNGQRIASKLQAGGYTVGDTIDASIGAQPAGSAWPFDGAIDEVRIFNYGLTRPEILERQ